MSELNLVENFCTSSTNAFQKTTHSKRFSTDTHKNWATCTHACLTWNLSSHPTTSTFFQISTNQRNNLTPAIAERNQIVHLKENVSNQMYSTKPLSSQRRQLKLTLDWQQTLRNITKMISPPFDTRTEEMKRNSQNIFGLYKTLGNLSRYKSFKEM